MIDILGRLADEIDSWATASARPGHLAALERIAAELRVERDRFHSWAGLIALLDEHYPSDVFGGESSDPGPRIIALTREVDATHRVVAALRELVALKDGPRDEHYQATKDYAWERARLMLLDLDGPATADA